MKYRLYLFEYDEDTGTRSLTDIMEVTSDDRGCNTPIKAINKLMKFAEKQGNSLADNMFQIENIVKEM